MKTLKQEIKEKIDKMKNAKNYKDDLWNAYSVERLANQILALIKKRLPKKKKNKKNYGPDWFEEYADKLWNAGYNKALEEIEGL